MRAMMRASTPSAAIRAASSSWPQAARGGPVGAGLDSELRSFIPLVSRLSLECCFLRKKAAGGCVDLGGLHERSRSQPTRLVSVWETRDAFLHGFHRNDSNAALCQPFAPFIELLWYPNKISWLVCDDFRASTKMFTLECAMSYCNRGATDAKGFHRRRPDPEVLDASRRTPIATTCSGSIRKPIIVLMPRSPTIRSEAMPQLHAAAM